MMGHKTHIHDLPSEILHEIFDYLPFDDHKNAALVCQLWNFEAFSPYFLDQVVFRMFPDQLAVITDSFRIYRHLHICKITKRDWPTILPVLERIGMNLYSLSVVFFTTPQLWQLHQSTPYLKQLTLDVSCCELIFEIDHLPSWTKVKEFTINYNTSDDMGAEFLNLAPNMTSLILAWRSDTFIGESLPVVQRYTPQLKHLDLGEKKGKYDGINESALQQCFRIATKLESALVRFSVSYQTVETIVDRCRHLKMLFFCIDQLKTNQLKILDNLPELRVLRIRSNSLIQNGEVQHSPLLKVKTLCLQLNNNPNIAAIEYLSKRLPNVQTLKVMIGDNKHQISADVVNQICFNFRRLKFLTLFDRSYCPPLPMEGFQQLQHLHQLEELTLTNIEVAIAKLPITNIRRLRLNRCKLDPNLLPNLAQLMPKLIYLGFRDSNFVKKHIPTVSLALPNCKVEMNDKLSYHQVIRIYCMEI